MYDLKDEHTKDEWPDVTKIYRKNKRKRNRIRKIKRKWKKNRDRSRNKKTKGKWKETIITEKMREK